jgi:hypothetical protein
VFGWRSQLHQPNRLPGSLHQPNSLTPSAPPVAEGLWGSPTCLGDLDGDGTSELAWGDPWLE